MFSGRFDTWPGYCVVARPITFTVPLSTKECIWVPGDCWRPKAECWEVICEGFYIQGVWGGGGGGSNSTPDQFMLWKLELVSAESYELAGFKRLFQHKRIVTPYQLLMRGQSQSRIRASFSGRYLRVNI